VAAVLGTRRTLQAMCRVLEEAGATVVGEMVVFTEGDGAKWPEVISLGNLPVVGRAGMGQRAAGAVACHGYGGS
jgi:hypothetical protein